MPSTKLLNVKIKSIPCLEQDGMVWVWPGDEPPSPTLPCLQPPSGFVIHAEVSLINHFSYDESSTFSYLFSNIISACNGPTGGTRVATR